MKRPLFFALFLLVLLASCGAPLKDTTASNKIEDKGNSSPGDAEATDEQPKPVAEQVRTVAGFLVNNGDTLVKVDAYNKNIRWELKYATADNFMKRVLYDTLKAVYVQKSVAERLAKCQRFLTAKDSSLHLLVYDGLRPLSVQWEMWIALDTIPVADRGKFVSNPKNGSVHNYGAAVDITICNSAGKPLDMGAGYDDIRRIAYPSLESEFLASGELTKAHIANRNLLRSTMRSQSFLNIPTEWWHFNAYPRAVVKGKWKIVRDEL